MDVSEFDPEFKVKMHNAAVALSESMAGRSTILYSFNCSEQSAPSVYNKVIEWVFCILRVTLFHLGSKPVVGCLHGTRSRI